MVAAAAAGAALRAAGDQGPPLPLLRRLRPRDGGAHGGRLRQANAASLPLPQRPPARPRLLPPLEENLRYATPPKHMPMRSRRLTAQRPSLVQCSCSCLYPTNESIPSQAEFLQALSPGSTAAPCSVRLRNLRARTEPDRREESQSINMSKAILTRDQHQHELPSGCGRAMRLAPRMLLCCRLWVTCI